ncbi:MAG: ComEC/Rec2 family competence protein [Candidatus Omnitrophota bacterium]|nr:ComEC/Rec2 family competence protein [Candidatus Omnitrophota bacterium]
MKSKNFGHLLLFGIFLAFLTGIILGHSFPLFWVFLSACVFSGALVIFFYKKQRLFLSDIFIIVLFISLGGLWVIPSARHSRGIVSYLGEPGEYVIKVISLPQEQSKRNSLYAIVKAFNKRVRVNDYTRSLGYLGSYRLKARLSKQQYKGKAFYSLWVKKDAKIEQLPQSFWDSYARKTTDYILGVFKNNLSEQGYRFMSSVLLGRREVLGDEKQILTDSGVAHLLALSGLHLGLISLIVFFILRLFYLPFRKCLIISVLFLFLYTFLTGMAQSTLRAALMYSFFVTGFFVKRRVNLLNSLGLAGLCMLIMNPLALFEVGFQLSYLAVFALIVWFKIFPIKVFKNRFFNYVQGLFFCSFCVTLFLTPLISYYFGRIYFFSVLYNLILIPVFTLLLTTGFLLIVFSALGFIAQSIGSILSLGVFGFVFLSRVFGSFSLAYFECRFSSYMAGVYYVLLTVTLVIIWRYRKLKRVINERG